MQEVNYAVIAIRQDYRGSDDHSKVVIFIETIYASNRLILQLKGLLIIGYWGIFKSVNNLTQDYYIWACVICVESAQNFLLQLITRSVIRSTITAKRMGVVLNE
jgi:hypothetical protein